MKKAAGLQRFMLDCGFWRARKWVGTSLDAIGLWTCGISYSHEHGTDGRLPKDGLALALGIRERGVRRALGELLARGVWRDTLDAYEIVGYADHNPSRRDIENYRATKAAASAKGNHERWHQSRTDPNCPLCLPPALLSDSGIPPGIPTWDPTSESQSDPTSESQSDPTKDPRCESISSAVVVKPPLPPRDASIGDASVGNRGGVDQDQNQNQDQLPPQPISDDLAWVLEQPELVAYAEQLARHVVEHLWSDQPRRLEACRDVAIRCMSVADKRFVDDCFGEVISSGVKPGSPNYLLAAVKSALVAAGGYEPSDPRLDVLTTTKRPA